MDAIKKFYSSVSHSYYPRKMDDVIVKSNSNYCKIPTKKREPKLSFLSFLSSFTFFDWHECDVSHTKVS